MTTQDLKSTKETNQSNPKKHYQFILSSKQPTPQLSTTINQLIKQSLLPQVHTISPIKQHKNNREGRQTDNHLPFLLHSINWFEAPFTSYRKEFYKTCRLYRSTERQSVKVIYNLIVQRFFNSTTYQQSLSCLIQLFSSDGNDHHDLVAVLREKYPHKLRPIEDHTNYLHNLLQLCSQFRKIRVELFEIIIQNLVKFDTEILLADEEVHNPFPKDTKMVELRKNAGNNDLAIKLDILLGKTIEYFDNLSEDATLLDQLLLVFYKKVLPIKTTKNIQLLVFIIAQKNRKRVNTFISFLLSNVFERQEGGKQNWYRLFTQSNFYLFSYLARSRKVTEKSITKTILILIQGLRGKLEQLEPLEINPKTSLKQTLQALQIPLLILQTIIMIKMNHSCLQVVEINEKFEELLGEARVKLQYSFFLHEQILSKIEEKNHRKSHLKLKFSNKFLPSTLPTLGPLTDELMTMDHNTRLNGEETGQAHRKIARGETPISYCSDTVI